MKRTTVRMRLALLSIAVVAMLVAVPASAFAAKATTKFTVASSTIVDHDTATENLWPVPVTATIRVKSGSRYVALKSGTVRLYRYNTYTGKYDALGYVKSSSSGSVSLSIPQRGKYKLYYAGSSTRKACTSYTTVMESIGAVLGEPLVTIEPGPGTTHYVVLTYAVSWNTAAYEDPMLVSSNSQFQDAADYMYEDWDAYVSYSREVRAPRTLEFRYQVDESEMLSHLWTERSMFIMDPYVVYPESAEYVWETQG